MRKSSILFGVCAFTAMGVYSASATLPAPAFVDVIHGDNTNTATFCAEKTPCADLNTALSVLGTGGANVVIIVSGGIFGPVVINQDLDIIGTSPDEYANIIADPTAQTGCIGALPGSCPTNNGYALEFNGGANDGLRLTHVAVRGGSGSSNALKMSSGHSLKITSCIFNGGDAAPAVQIYPNTGGGSFVNVYFSHSQINGGSGSLAGAVEVIPSGNTNVGLHFNHVQVSGAGFGIRTDGSGITSANSVSTFVSNSEFFSILNAAVNAFSSAGHGRVQATFDTNHILNAGVGLKANGPLSSVVLTNNTVSSNGTGILVQGGATVMTSGNNTIRNNGTDLDTAGGTFTAVPMN